MSTEDKAIAVIDQPMDLEQRRFMPLMTMSVAVERRNAIKEAIGKLMEEGQDYGKIPGAGTKPTLLQPGAQKLDNLFGLVPRFELVDKVEDWTGADHGGEPFFRYLTRCVLYRGDFAMGEGMGECNSFEAKYRWRKSERVCPACGQACIIKGKPEYGGGWICFSKKGGCGAKYSSDARQILDQEVGRVANTEIFDQVNTLLKMANKRAHVAATINTTSASEFFTQDIEDIPGSQAATDAVAEQKIANGKTPAGPQVASHKPAPAEKASDVPPEVQVIWAGMSSIKGCCEALATLKQSLCEVMGKEPGEWTYYHHLEQHGAKHANEFKSSKPARLCARDLYNVLQQETALRKHENPPASSFHATDADLPDGLWPDEKSAHPSPYTEVAS